MKLGTLVGITNLPAQLKRDTLSRLKAKQLYNSKQSIMRIELALMALMTLTISGCTSIPYTFELYEKGSANGSPVENARERIAGRANSEIECLIVRKVGAKPPQQLKVLIVFEGKPVYSQKELDAIQKFAEQELKTALGKKIDSLELSFEMGSTSDCTVYLAA